MTAKIYTNSLFIPNTVVGLFLCLLFLSIGAMAQDEPTLENIRDAILGAQTFTQDELNGMDIDGNGLVDVSDMISLLNPEFMFKGSTSLIEEGSETTAVIYLPTIYSGTVNYTIEGSAVNGQDYVSLNGFRSINGSSVSIPIETIDDTDQEGMETIIITIDTVEGNWLELGPVLQYVVTIQDNDTLWKGKMSTQNMVVGFDLVLLQEDSSYTAVVNSDGLGIIPAGEWPATAEVTASLFRCVIGPIDMLPEATPFDVPMARTLTLESAPDSYPDDVLNAEIIIGRMEETISVGEDREYMNLTGAKSISGNFALVKGVTE